jgi:ferrous iron transport protein B
MSGHYRYDGRTVEVVDLPGTYSLTSYSPEERVSRDFILHEKPSLVINVTDASNLKRSLYLTFQLMEMEIPLVLNLNMMDVAKRLGVVIDTEGLAEHLGVAVVPTSMKNGTGKKTLFNAVAAAADGRRKTAVRIDYGEMEPFLRNIEKRLADETTLPAFYPSRWVAIKLMEGDEEAQNLVRADSPRAAHLLRFAERLRGDFEARFDEAPELFIAHRRYREADDLERRYVTPGQQGVGTLSDRIDQVVCHRLLGPIILLGVIWLLYYLSIVQGYHITNYTWPLLAKIRSLAEAVTPQPGFIEIPMLRALVLWFVDSVNALLNYIPIFFILFGLIAILEDSGYMPRMAFIMDRLFSRYGLHGQSTLPMVLGGIYVGGCAVPGVMACKGIPDERSRLATILIIPMLNCLAKVPLYVLLINIYFAAHKAWAMFFISTISMLIVLPVSRILTLTVLKDKETAPFVMEMPPYHLPTLRGVLGRAVERVWLFIRKITTIVAAVAVVIFALLQFPGIDDERQVHYDERKDKVVADFMGQVEDTLFAADLQGDGLMAMILYWDEYKNARMLAKGPDAMDAFNATYEARNPVFYRMVQPGKDKVARQANRAFKQLYRQRQDLLREIRKERIDNSFLGRLGQWLEPATRFAGFNWRVNVALLSAFAAKESSVATLGALYEPEEEGEALETRMARGEEGFTPLHALALMLFMVLYPPCLATSIAVKIQTGSVKWMLFSMAYPMALGLLVAGAVFSGGSALGLSGLQAMFVFYGLALALTVATGLLREKERY